MVLKIDKIDKRIINRIFNNFREPISKTARKCKISREQAEYRINKFEKSKLINGYLAIFNLEMLGYNYNYLIRISLNTINNKLEDIKFKSDILIITKLICIGKWNYVLTTYSKSKENILDFISELYSIFENNLIDYEIIEPVNSYFLPLKIFNNNTLINYNKYDVPNIKIDNIDKKIIKILSKNANMKIIDIAKKINEDPNIVKYRIKRMEKSNFINYRIFLNIKVIKYNYAILYIKINNLNLKNKNKIVEYATQYKPITACAICIGKYNVLYQIIYKDMDEFNNIITTITNFLKDSIINYDVVHIKDEFEPCTLPNNI